MVPVGAAATMAVTVVMAAIVLPAVAMAVTVMVAGSIFGEPQGPTEKGLHRLIRIPRYPCVEADPRIPKGILGARADAAADKGIHSTFLQESRQRPMAVPIGVHDLRGRDLPVGDLIDLELLRMAEVLKDFSVFISDRNFFHLLIPPYLPLFRPRTGYGAAAGFPPPLAEIV